MKKELLWSCSKKNAENVLAAVTAVIAAVIAVYAPVLLWCTVFQLGMAAVTSV